MLDRVLGKVTEVRAEQLEKALLAILVRVFGKITEVRAEQL